MKDSFVAKALQVVCIMKKAGLNDFYSYTFEQKEKFLSVQFQKSPSIQELFSSSQYLDLIFVVLVTQRQSSYWICNPMRNTALTYVPGLMTSAEVEL